MEEYGQGVGDGDVRILELLAKGLTDKAIARELKISVFTVNKRVGQVLRKMCSASRTEAAIKAVRQGII